MTVSRLVIIFSIMLCGIQILVSHKTKVGGFAIPIIVFIVYSKLLQGAKGMYGYLYLIIPCVLTIIAIAVVLKKKDE